METDTEQEGRACQVEKLINMVYPGNCQRIDEKRGVAIVEDKKPASNGITF